MKFALMIYQPHPFDPALWTEEEFKAIAADYAAINATQGVTPGLPLGLPAKAVTVRVNDGVVEAFDGPHAGPKGAVRGYLIFEAESMDQAVALAARVPAARIGGAVEVRPCEIYW
jgi:hypothetical protein